MDLRARLRSWALARPRVLLVDAPGETTLRWSVEAELDRRGWPRAASPADTDLLVVVGVPGPELAAAVDLLWSQVPEPRYRLAVSRGDALAAALDSGRDALVRRAGTAPDEDDRPSPAALLGEDGTAEHEDAEHEDADHGGMDHGDHGGGVAGLPMASTGADRDGLELDVLRVALGPVLPGWPTGLVLRADLQGDVLTSVDAAWLDADTVPAAPPLRDPRRAALDRLARFLDVAGWPTAARDARRARDGLGADGPARESARRSAEVVARRVRRSRALAWTAGGLGLRQGGSEPAGSVLDEVRRWCDLAAGQAVPEAPVPALAEVAAALEGMEIGSARLLVAGLDLAPVAAAPEHAHA